MGTLMDKYYRTPEGWRKMGTVTDVRARADGGEALIAYLVKQFTQIYSQLDDMQTRLMDLQEVVATAVTNDDELVRRLQQRGILLDPKTAARRVEATLGGTD